MDKNIDDGGPAFPVPDTYLPNRQVQYGTNGMSLRDYFAAKAMAALVARRLHPEPPGPFISDDAYMMADQMLASRKRSF